MRYFLQGRKGAALITVIALIVVTSLMVAAVYYFLRRGIEVSGLQKKYQTAREASLGGLDVFTKEILPIAISGTNLSSVISTQFSAITSAQVVQVATDTCFRTKLLQETANWGGCSSSLDAKTNSDITFVLSGSTPGQFYNVYTKIVDTVQGNSSTTGILLEGQGTAETQTGMIAAQHFPYEYRFELQSEKNNDATEKANFTVLYAY